MILADGKLAVVFHQNVDENKATHSIDEPEYLGFCKQLRCYAPINPV